MNENTNLLSPEREAEIREALALLAQLNARAESIPLPKNDEAAETAEWYANMAADLLTALDAQREQFRQALRGLVLPRVIPDKSAANSEQVYFQGRADCIRGNNTRIRRTAASLGIDLQDLL